MINLKSSLWSFILLITLFFLGVGLIYAEENPEDVKSINRWNFFLGGGYGYSESRAGLIEVQAEVQFNVSSNVYFGVGIGYLSDSDNDHMDGNFDFMSGRRMGGGMMHDGTQSMTGGFSRHRHNFTVIPLTVSVYYALPVSARIDVFMSGGAGYYWASFNDISKQKNIAFGPHAGLGVEYKITNRITAVAHGLYRFVNLEGFMSELHPGFREGMEENEHEEGSWHLHHDDDEYHFHDTYEISEQMMRDSSPFNIRLNGFSLRAGIKFGF